MKTEEYGKLELVEKKHWFYRGKRRIVRHWIDRLWQQKAEECSILDYGAGTGAFAKSIEDLGRISVLDAYPESQEMLRKHFNEKQMIEVSQDGLKMESEGNRFDFVTALDVLEHIEKDGEAVKEILRVLKPGGHLIVTVPADMKLWSYWDEELFHFRRYTRSGLVQLFDGVAWKLNTVCYTNFAAYWPIRLVRRLFQKRTPEKAKEGGVRLEDVVPFSPANEILEWFFVEPAKVTNFPAPFGVSLLLVATKQECA